MVNIYLIAIVILTVMCVVYSDNTVSNDTIHVRVKRGRYYSSPPQRFYRRPPITYPVKGLFSYTPPPGYMEDEEPQHPAYKPKVSRKPKEGLGDEDINNIVKYLSKQDLDKIIEFAGEKERIRDNSIEKKPFKREEYQYKEQTEQYLQNGYKNDDSNFKFNNGFYRLQESDSQIPQSLQQSYGSKVNTEQQFSGYKPQDDQKLFGDIYAANEDLVNYIEDATQPKVIYINQDRYSNAQLQPEESTQNRQVSYLNTHIYHEINDLPGTGQNIFTDSRIMKEEELPKPVNLRDDFEISYTNNVPTVVKPNYDVKNFGDLPLMSNDYKLDTVSSYKVPHYTVTSNSKYAAPASQSQSSYSNGASSTASQKVPVEPAPPVSEAKEQSDAHLKAIKIWTHRSKGTAYTLHNDGTLSLEKPMPPKTKYGP